MLSQMFRQMFADNPLTMFPTVGLGIFLIVFTGVAINVMRRRPETFDDVARLPLDDEEVRHER